MKSSLIKINHFVPLLTDTLPYEVPFLFSNRGFYTSLKSDYDQYFNKAQKEKAQGNTPNEKSFSVFNFFKDEYFSSNGLSQLKGKIADVARKNMITIPYCYEIKKNELDYRSISLIHPLAQLKVCDLYKENKEAILFYCNRSPFSLRHPDRVTSRLVIKHANLLNKILKDEEQANTSDLKEKVIEDHETLSLSEVPNSYFVYEKYSKLHDFYDSPEYLDLEKKYSFCCRFDIKRCFDSIYTHAIAWAIKGKEYTKNNIKQMKKDGVFENEFDRLMQSSNYNETNGIPIGAEVSRIFAEIILQCVDIDLQHNLNTKKFSGRKVFKGADYEIKRYIDDFYVFTNDEQLAKDIQQTCEAELKHFKLFVNEAKSSLEARPFTTNITSAKHKIRTILNGHLKSYDEGKTNPDSEDSQPYFSKYVHYKSAMNILNQTRCVTHDYEITFYEVANIFLGSLKTDLLKKLSKLQSMDEKDIEARKHNIRAYLKNMVFISFYVFYSSSRSHTCSTIFKISFIITEILKILKDDIVSGEIKQELYSQCTMFCENLESSNRGKIIEFLDIILLMQELGDKYKLGTERLMRIFGIEEEKSVLTSDLSYFEIVVLLSYIRQDQEYRDIHQHLHQKILELLNDFNGLSKTENFLLFFDSVKSPYFTNDEKKETLKAIGLTKEQNHNAIISFIESKEWFFDWRRQENLDLKSVLEIKEAVQSY